MAASLLRAAHEGAAAFALADRPAVGACPATNAVGAGGDRAHRSGADVTAPPAVGWVSRLVDAIPGAARLPGGADMAAVDRIGLYVLADLGVGAVDVAARAGRGGEGAVRGRRRAGRIGAADPVVV